VLFEIFTGKRAYDAKTLHDLMQLHESGTVTTPSSLVRDLDPAVERVILRCLAATRWPMRSRRARRRRRGETEAVAILPAAGMAVGFLIVLLAFAAIAPRASIPGLVPLDKPAFELRT